MMNFKNWLLEMAMVSREKIFLDDDDISYLKQFPLDYWASALMLRYNDLIFKSTDNGELRRDWSDIQEVSVRDGSMGGGKRQTITLPNIDTKMTSLIQKLKNMGYDLSGTNPINKESLFYKPPSPKTTLDLTIELRSTISSDNFQKYKEEWKKFKPYIHRTEIVLRFKDKIHKIIDILDPKPNVVSFSPNHLKSKRNDPEPGQDGTFESKKEFDEFRPSIIKIIDQYINQLKNKPHPNATWWSQPDKREDVINHFLEYIWNNWKDPKFHSLKYLNGLVQMGRGGTLLQNGLISRRKHEKLLKMGTQLNDVFKKVNPRTGNAFTPNEIKSILDNTPDDIKRHQIIQKILNTYADVQTMSKIA